MITASPKVGDAVWDFDAEYNEWVEINSRIIEVLGLYSEGFYRVKLEISGNWVVTWHYEKEFWILHKELDANGNVQWEFEGQLPKESDVER